jgi:hypothetical protein
MLKSLLFCLRFFMPSDRVFSGILPIMVDTSKEAQLISQPETVIRRYRHGGALNWRWKSRPTICRPKTPQPLIDLI